MGPYVFLEGSKGLGRGVQSYRLSLKDSGV